MSKIRTRFAPSPTGFLHIGSLRTVLFVYLLAKSLDGKLILRIEDTDQKREIKGATKKLMEILDWVGIEFNEGPHIGGDYGPYIQSQRLNIYKKYTDKLLKTGQAYHCFCAPERLQKMREEQQTKKLPPRYDRKCRDLSFEEANKKIEQGEKFVIRQKMPLKGEILVHDELRGDIKFRAEGLEDHVLIKSNGIPTYQFALVVDDHLMEISHVIRGEEWIPSFPKNILLYQIFGWQTPKFYHIPLTLNKEGGKLSKRQGDVSVEDYRAKGYLQEAIINFCILLGWHPKNDKELWTLEELEKEFKIEDMGTSPAIFDIEKLDYLNGYYIRHMNLDKLVKLSRPYMERHFKKIANRGHSFVKIAANRFGIKEYTKKIIALEQERIKKLSEIGELTEFFFVDNLEYSSELLIWKKMTNEEVKKNLEKIYELLGKIPKENWTNNSIEDAIISYLKAKKLRVGEYLWPMRVALTGRKASPGPFEVAEILEKEESLKRINTAIKKIK